MKPIFKSPFLLLILWLLAYLVSCDNEHYEVLPRVHFVQADTVDSASSVRYESDQVILSGRVTDVETSILADQPIVEYGHIYAAEANRSFLADSCIRLSDIDTTLVKWRQGVGEFSTDLTTLNVRTTISENELMDSIDYLFRTYVVRPHDSRLFCSPISAEAFQRPTVAISIDTIQALPSNKMKLLATMTLSETENVDALGYRLTIAGSTIILDQYTEAVTANQRTYAIEIPVFEINQNYDIVPFVQFTRPPSPAILEALGSAESASYPGGNFWVRTNDIRPHIVGEQPEPNAKDMILFQQSDGKFIIGLGTDNDDQLLNQFWEFDPRFYTWNALSTWNLNEGGLQGGIHFQQENSRFYFGLGETNPTTLYGGQNGAWREVVDSTDFRNALKGVEVTAIEDEVVRYIAGRYNAWSYVKGNAVYFGGGLFDNVWERVVDVTPDAALGTADQSKKWYDWNKDGKIDNGAWVDFDGNGMINTNIPDLPDMLNVQHDGGNVQVDVLGGGNELTSRDSTGWIDNTTIRRCEWRDERRDNIVKVGEIYHSPTPVIRDDMWRWDFADGLSLQLPDTMAYRRYGGKAIAMGNRVFFLGGVGVTYDGQGNSQQELAAAACVGNGCPNDLQRFPRGAFPVAFSQAGSNLIYFGGGQDEGGNALPFSLQALNTTNGSTTPVSGCELTELVQGLGFFNTNGNKRFVGLGQREETSRNNELWMYITQ